MLCYIPGVVKVVESSSVTLRAEFEKELLEHEEAPKNITDLLDLRDDQDHQECLNTEQDNDSTDLDFRTLEGE